MTLLDACANFCAAVNDTLGPTISELLFIGALAALGWWRARKVIAKVEAKADAGIAAAHGEASKAKTEARDAKLQLAEIRGSMRPAMLTPSSGTSSSALEPVRFEGLPSSPRPSLVDPSLSGEEPLPSPSPLPSLRDTPLERPGGKR